MDSNLLLDSVDHGGPKSRVAMQWMAFNGHLPSLNSCCLFSMNVTKWRFFFFCSLIVANVINNSACLCFIRSLSNRNIDQSDDNSYVKSRTFVRTPFMIYRQLSVISKKTQNYLIVFVCIKLRVDRQNLVYSNDTERHSDYTQ